MTKIIGRIIISAIFVGFATITAAAKCSDSDMATLKKMDQDWGTWNQTRNKSALDALLAESYASFELVGHEGKAEAMAVMDTPAPEANGERAVSDHYIISCSGDTAVMTHRNEFKDDEGYDYTRSVHVFQKSGGKWKVIASANHPMNDGGTLAYMEMTARNAYLAKDMAYFKDLMHDDYVSVGIDGKVQNKEATIAYMKDDQTKFDSLEIVDMGMRVSGNTAVVVVTYHAKGTLPNGQPMEGKRKFTRTYAKDHGKWKQMSSAAVQLQMN